MMRKLLLLLAPGLLLAVAAPAGAAIYNTTFTGTVTAQQGNAATPVGSTITGAFVYSSDVSQFLSFRFDGFTATQPFSSIVSATPGTNPFTAIYEALTSAVQQGGSLNRDFVLDLEGPFPGGFSTSNPLALLTSPTLRTQLDPTSFFRYSQSNANGTGAVSVSASLTGLTTQVPEPISLALLAAPMLGLVLCRRR